MANILKSKLTITHFIGIGFVSGCIIGVLFRFFKPEFMALGINVTKFNILGKIFIDLIKMIIAPLIFCSVCTAILSTESGKSRAKLATKTIVVFFIFTLISSCIGLGASCYFKIGQNINFDKNEIIESSSVAVSAIKESAKTGSIGQMILGIIPDNLFQSFLKNDFLQIIFFAVIFSVAISASGDSGKSIAKSISNLSDVIFKVSDIVTKFAPFGIFGLSAWLIGTQDVGLIKSLGKLILMYYACAIFLTFFVYGASLRLLGLNPTLFFRKFFPIQFIAYTTSSTSATVSLAIKIAHEKLGISKEKANFIIPLGATINMNGGAMHLSMAAVFVAQVFGITLSNSELITVLSLSIIGAIGTAPIPGVSIFLLAGILGAVGVPIDGIAIIVTIDRLLDMMRTVCNVTGDSISAIIVDQIDGTLNKKIYVND